MEAIGTTASPIFTSEDPNSIALPWPPRPTKDAVRWPGRLAACVESGVAPCPLCARTGLYAVLHHGTECSALSDFGIHVHHAEQLSPTATDDGAVRAPALICLHNLLVRRTAFLSRLEQLEQVFLESGVAWPPPASGRGPSPGRFGHSPPNSIVCPRVPSAGKLGHQLDTSPRLTGEPPKTR